MKGIFHTFRFSLLFLFKRGADRPLTVAGAAALDIHMVGMTFVIGIVDAFHRFTVNADGPAGMGNGAFKGIHSLPLLPETLAAGAVTAAGVVSAHHNVSLTAQMLIIVGTVFYRTF